MHVLYVTTTYPPETGWGGIGTYVFHAAQGLRALGHRVTVMCTYAKTPGERVESGVDVLRILPQTNEDDAWRSDLARKVEAVVNDRAVDLVEFTEYGAIGIDFQRAHPDFPVASRFEGSSELCASDAPFWLKLLRRIRGGHLKRTDQRERESVERAHMSTSCSQWLLDVYREQGWKWKTEPVVVYNPISDASASTDGDLTLVGEPLIVTLGRFEDRKGADLLPEIVRRVCDAYPAAKFRVLGQDCVSRFRPEGWIAWARQQLGTLADRVDFAGGVEHHRVHEELRRCRIAYFGSTWESYGYTHVEAMQAGLPTVVASIGGAGELGIHGQTFLRVGRSAREIADALLSLLNNPAEAERMGRAGTEYAREHFSATVIAGQLVDLYAATVERARGRKLNEVTV